MAITTNKISKELLTLVFDSVVAGFLKDVKTRQKYGVETEYVNPDIGGGKTAGDSKYHGETLLQAGNFSDNSVNYDMLEVSTESIYGGTDSNGDVKDLNGLVRTVNSGKWWKKTGDYGNTRYNFKTVEADAMTAHAVARCEQIGSEQDLRGQYYGLVLLNKGSKYKIVVAAASNATEVELGTLAQDYSSAKTTQGDWIHGINNLSKIMSESATSNAELEDKCYEEVLSYLKGKDITAGSDWESIAQSQATKMARSGMQGITWSDNTGANNSKLKAVRCTHGMIRSMGALICSGSDADNAVCSEMSLTQGTTKAGACITCAMYMWSCGAGFNRLHLGASELWSLPSAVNIGLRAAGGQLHEAKNIRNMLAEPVRVGEDTDWGNDMLNNKNKKWGDDIKEWFKAGYNLLQDRDKLQDNPADPVGVIEGIMETELGNKMHISEVYLMSLGLGRKARDTFTELTDE